MADEYFRITLDADIKCELDSLKEKLNLQLPTDVKLAKKSYPDTIWYLLQQHNKAEYLTDKVELMYNELINKLAIIKQFIEAQTFQCSECGSKNGQKIIINYEEIFGYIDDDIKLIREVKEKYMQNKIIKKEQP